MPPPDDEMEAQEDSLEDVHTSLKIESQDLPSLHGSMGDEEYIENEDDQQYISEEVHFKTEAISMSYVNQDEDQYENQNEKNDLNLMDNLIIDGNSAVTFSTLHSDSFEVTEEPMETEEAEISDNSSQHENFSPLSTEKQESNIFIGDENILEGAQLEEKGDVEIPAVEEEEGGVVEGEAFFKDEETTLQSEELFHEQPVEAEFIQDVMFNPQSSQEELYGTSEQVIETTETEVPADFISETVETVQNVVTEEVQKPKTIIAQDGSVLQLKSSNFIKKFVSADAARAHLKRPLLPGPGQPKNMFTKVIIQGNPNSSTAVNQPFKIIGTSGPSLVSSQTRSITFAQAQQMGLIAPGTKLQQIQPNHNTTVIGGGQKRMIVKKIVSSGSGGLLSPTNTTKSPTKILPAPTPKGIIRPTVTAVRGPVNVANIQVMKGGIPGLKSVPALSNTSPIRPMSIGSITALRQSGVTGVSLKPGTTVKSITGSPTTPQRVIIRQGQLPMKGGTIISQNTGQVIRIPPNSNSFQPIQITGGKQVQYVRFVSGTGNTLPSTVTNNNSKSKFIKSAIAQPSYKTFPIAPSPSPGLVKTVLPKPTSSPSTAKRILIPVSQAVPQLSTIITNDSTSSTVNEESNGKVQTVTTVPVSAFQQIKSSGTITGVTQLRQGKTITLSSAQLKTATAGKLVESGETAATSVNQTTSDGSFVMPEGSIVMLSPDLVHQIHTGGEEVELTEQAEKEKQPSDSEMNDEENFDKENIDSDGRCSTSPKGVLEANGMRMKKPCNCTRSQCLKLYCECFANGEFCFQCNCNNCFNNIEHEEERQKSIRSCLERNPTAFRPKIQHGDHEEDERRHNKGCHCKRSGCLKNYCECYEAKITCSKYCKCMGCRNTEEFLENSRNGLIDLADLAEENFNPEPKSDVVLRPQSTNSSSKQPYNFMSSEVVEATCQCLLAQAEEAERNRLTTEDGERLIIEEFGRCLVQIIGFSKVDDNVSR